MQHENYSPNTLANDIALIELDDAADINQYVDVVEMAEPSDGDFAFVDCFIIGWGGDQCKQSRNYILIKFILSSLLILTKSQT